ncbi:MAG: hypothetical protein Q4C77_14305 [Eubacteriales bacterium]|nr:hypothetical protein [Eubacteriales bacterium]
MYYDKFYPFYTTYADPMFIGGEKMQEKEFEMMKSYYPETARRIQDKVEEECQLLDYEGSRLYDEYPDKFMLHHLCRRIRKEVEPEMAAQEIPGGFLDDLIQVLLYQEISRRRCRRHRCRRYF